jgi:hypothetical protein
VPGGARKFNLPVYDRGGTPGFPYTPEADGTKVWEDFSTTSNCGEPGAQLHAGALGDRHLAR